jgi:hypothetical protein
MMPTLQRMTVALVLIVGCSDASKKSPRSAGATSLPQTVTFDAGARPPAPAASSQLVMQAAGYMNMHSAFGAQGSSSNSSVKLTFVSSTDVRVEDTGERQDYVMHEKFGVKEDESKWTNLWEGSWSVQSGKMTLDLKSSTHQCTRHASDYGGPKEPMPCPAIQLEAVVECAEAVIDVEGAQSDNVWMCSSNNPNMGGTSMPWVFGRQRCLERVGGAPMQGGFSYEPCNTVPL